MEVKIKDNFIIRSDKMITQCPAKCYISLHNRFAFQYIWSEGP
jgi:hypothetical protein